MKLLIKAQSKARGMNWIVRMDELPWDDEHNAKMDFGLLMLEEGTTIVFDKSLEMAILLLTGDVRLSWGISSSKDDATQDVKRASIFDGDPCCLHVSSNTRVTIMANAGNSELAIFMTRNEAQFPAKLYMPSECHSEQRGKGTMRETSTRVVRTIFDADNAPDAKLVLGEVINHPGKWSSYPPHKHPQPEIYHYRFLPEQGFGACFLGDEAVKVQNGDTVKIFGVTHPQTAAPGYAMFYIWAIRHLDGNPYGAKFGTPIFDPEHTWVMKKENEGRIWPPNES